MDTRQWIYWPELCNNVAAIYSGETVSLIKLVQVVVAGRSVFKIYSIEDEGFVERENLRVGKNINLNYR